MTRYTSTLGPFMLTRLAVIALGAQFEHEALPDMVTARPPDGSTVTQRARQLVAKMQGRAKNAPPAEVIDLGDMTHEQAEKVASLAGKVWLDRGDYVSLEPCEMCREPFHPSALDCEPYGRICDDCYWSLPG